MSPEINFSVSTKVDEILEMEDRLEAFMKLAFLYKSCNDKQRDWIRARWDFGVVWKYPRQWTLAQKIDGQPKPADRIYASLIHEAIQDSDEDTREQIFGFGVIYLSAQEIGLDPISVFSEVASMASQATSTRIMDFANRSEKDKSIEAFCLNRIPEKTGVRYELI